MTASGISAVPNIASIGAATAVLMIRMHRGIIDRLPGRVALGGRVVIAVTVADRRDRPPELVVIFGVEHSDGGVGGGDGGQRHEARAFVSCPNNAPVCRRRQGG
jgi:hypothetical protein